MSASSNCVTCGIITQLRARLAPEIFLMRDSGFASTGPNFAKSTVGHGSRLSEPPPLMPPPAAPAAAPPPLIACFTKPCTSSCWMRPLGPVPFTRARSTPSSRANLRTDGDACAALKASPSTGAAVLAAGGAGTVGGVTAGAGAGVGAVAAGGGAAAAGAGAGAAGAAFAAAGAAAAPAASSSSTSVPSLTLSPSFSFISFTTPAAGDGTSIVALSDSSVTSESSAFTVSPGFTKTSMTGMSLKSPMSGTLTSIVLMVGSRRRGCGVGIVRSG